LQTAKYGIIISVSDCVQTKMGFDSARFIDEVDAELICSICHGILEDPRQVCIVLLSIVCLRCLSYKHTTHS